MRAILAFSFHPAFTPPKSGGEERLFFILKGLSQYYKVTLVSFTHPNKNNTIENVTHTRQFKEVRIPKTDISLFLHYFVNKFSSIPECSAVITSIESRFNQNFKIFIREELQKTDIVIFESPFLYTIPGPLLKGKKIVYNAYNNEFDLMKPVFSNSLIGNFFLRYVYRIEKNLSRQSDLIFAVSKEDRNSLINTYHIGPKKIYFAPNGIPVALYDPIFFKRSGNKNPPVCLFIGSYHPPNIEAVYQILKISALLPEVVFTIVGNVSHFFTHQEGVTEWCRESEKTFFENFKDVHLIAGFHILEHWDKTPIIWSKQVSEISISEKIESLSMRVYSPQNQTIRVTGKSIDTIFSLFIGWNTLTIPVLSPCKMIFSLSCEKEYRDNGRILGIALAQMDYTKKGEKYIVDLNICQNRISRFIASKNVFLLGQITDEERNDILKISDIALNPMMSGSGTNIKVLGYLSAGVPTITTQMGARGLDLIDHKHALICDIADFPQKIRDLLSDEMLAESLTKNGHILMEEKFNWESIVKDMAEKIEGI